MAAAEAAAAAAVGKEDDSGGPVRHTEIPVDDDARGRYLNGRRSDRVHGCTLPLCLARRSVIAADGRCVEQQV
jgi:hypothetical protein